MQKFRLKNGLTVVHERRKGDSVAVEVSVNSGSNDENDSVSGISHFLEHMLFEGTKKRTAREIAGEIENLGGEFNAATDNERTFYYVVLLSKYFEKAVEILSDMLLNSSFPESAVKKEKKVVLEEIKTTDDDPKLYQWIAFQKNLFDSADLRRPIYGTKQAVQALTREKIISYYKKHYVPSNMIVSVVGDVANVRKTIERHFGSERPRKLKRKRMPIEYVSYKKTNVTINKNMQNSYVVIGYKAPGRRSRDSYVFDVINAILGKGQSGRLFNEFRIKRGLAYMVGSHFESSMFSNYIAAYVSTGKATLEKCKRLLVEQLQLNGITSKELQEAKKYIEGHILIKREDIRERVDMNAFWASFNSSPRAYLGKVKSVSLKDVERVRKKYFNGNYTLLTLRER